MPETAVKHRRVAREQLAEATALAAEGRVADSTACLRAAMGHAVGALAADQRLDAASVAGAIAVLVLRGVLPFDARALWQALDRAEPRGVEAGAADSAGLIVEVQAVVDLSAGVRGRPSAGRRWQRWGAPDDDETPFGGEPLPVRGAGWARAAARDRGRRRLRRARRVTATGGCALVLGVLGLAWSDSVDGTAYRPPKADIGFFDSGS